MEKLILKVHHIVFLENHVMTIKVKNRSVIFFLKFNINVIYTIHDKNTIKH
jgi:hypothetical protein